MTNKKSKKNNSSKKKSNKASNSNNQPQTENHVPSSMIFRRGKVGLSVKTLIEDLRRVMLPSTALNLQESKKNSLRDFINVAPTLGVTHLISLSQNPEIGVNLRIIRVPRGPTLTFRVTGYCNMKDVANSQKKPHSPGSEFKHSAVLVLNGFSTSTDHNNDNIHLKLMCTTFQAMFPAIDVSTVKLKDCRRVVLINYDKEKDGEIQIRHYLVKASPVGLTKQVKAVAVKAKLPDLGGLTDISQFLDNPNSYNTSDSELEDNNDSKLTLSQTFQGRGNKSKAKSAIRLKEIGPRIIMKLLKIEEEACGGGGKVLYHSYIKRTLEEKKAQEQKKEQERLLKLKRKAQQELNVKRKSNENEEENDNEHDDDEDFIDETQSKLPDDIHLEDRDYYRQEVGVEPEDGEFNYSSQSQQAGNKRRRRDDTDQFIQENQLHNPEEEQRDKDDQSQTARPPNKNSNSNKKSIKNSKPPSKKFTKISDRLQNNAKTGAGKHKNNSRTNKTSASSKSNRK